MTLSVRTRLIIALVLLSVLPLSAVTLLSYRASVQAFERAAQREASERAADVSRRMDIVTADLGQRVDRMFVATTSEPRLAGGQPDAEKLRASVAPILGDTAALIDRVEFHPATPEPPHAAAAASPAPAATPVPPAPPVPGAPARPRRPDAIVVDIPQIVADAQREARASGAPLNPALATIIERSMLIGMASAEQGLRAASEILAREDARAANEARHRVKMAVHGRALEVDVHKDGKLVGKASATLNLDRTLRAVLAFAQREQGEIPFAIDRSGKLHTPNTADLPRLEMLGVAAIAPRAADRAPRRTGEWIVVAKRDAGGIIFGIARPIGQSLREIRSASARNLALGLGVIALAFIGIVPISRGMTQHLSALTAGVRQLAAGDFRARVPVRSADEFGTLASAFNQMAADLERQQSLVVEQERLRRELELSRQIQTEMLPRRPFRSGVAEIAGVSVPAREVGGDFFNYFDLPDGRLALLVGDVSGKGVSAALLMANAQATLRARLPHEPDLSVLADSFDRELDGNTPRSVYLTLFVAILEEDGRTLRYVNAGHNPQFVVRKRGGIERLSATGLPIALYAGHGYEEARVQVEPGDLVFFYTDGLVEAENAAGEMFGAERLEELLRGAQAHEIAALLALVEQRVRAFTGATEPLDDATMMALRVSGPTTGPPPA